MVHFTFSLWIVDSDTRSTLNVITFILTFLFIFFIPSSSSHSSLPSPPSPSLFILPSFSLSLSSSYYLLLLFLFFSFPFLGHIRIKRTGLCSCYCSHVTCTPAETHIPKRSWDESRKYDLFSGSLMTSISFLHLLHPIASCPWPYHYMELTFSISN